MHIDEPAVGRSPILRVATAVGGAGAGSVVAAARDAAGDVPVVRTGPTGLTATDPLVLATVDGETAFVPNADAERARAVAAALADGRLPEGATTVTHDPETATLPVPEDGPLAVGRRVVLGPCGWVNPRSADDHTFTEEVPDAAGVLRGRGRGDVGGRVREVWDTVRDTDGESVVVVNANEARPEQRNDRTLLAADPMSVLDGADAVARYVGAADVIVHLNEEDSRLHTHLREVVDAAEPALSTRPQLVVGPDEYRAGAPTPALEALEGADRIEPRLQPPTPAEYGLYGRPTVVHTPRTFAQVAAAAREPAAYDADAPDPGTRLFSVTGDVAAPGVVELPSTAPLSAALDAVTLEGPWKAAVVGGRLGGLARELDLPATASALESAGLGTDGVVELLSERRCVLAEVGKRARFAAEENSGRCVPGREGTVQLAELLRDIYDGELDADGIRELARVMERTSNCRLGAHAPRPVRTALDEFEPELRAHARGRCPSGACDDRSTPLQHP